MTLTATTTLEEAARRTRGAVVVGAGPAGATAARELARRGVDVLLVDRASFPRWKVCGCCLNGRAARLLDAAGLGKLAAIRQAVPLKSICLASGGRLARVPLSGGVALSRESFDAALIRAAVEAGAAFLPDTRAILLKKDAQSPGCAASRRILLQQGEKHAEVSARVVLAADGLAGQFLARTATAAPAEAGARIGAGTTTTDAPDFYQPGVVYMTCGAGGYTGMVRLEDGRLDAAAAFDASEVRGAGGLGAAAVRLLLEAGWPIPDRLADLPWRGTPPLTRQARQVAAERLFVVGDAAGYIEPFTGEGMAWALASGAAVAPLAARAVERWRPELVRQWAAVHRRVVSRRQTVCRTAAAVLRRPWLTRLMVRLLSRAPMLAAPVIGCLNL
jgi:flavin-dependent dehydrogenase